ncbi:hypothetical protein Bca52824_040205 [Brassica carinata]|uniref:DUF4283 domain-containing protein n=1 Tax=Brassica carinata TaxID=52824 RepID=A0A8X7UXN0_BRACI|nr:hypothetical protein Bca52824_040205 [Brassica carinata]
MPSYQAIQSVLNYLWEKGQKLDIRTNLQDRTILVRIPNEFIRKKVLEKRLWYVGTAMFQVSRWTSSKTVDAIDFSSIPLWAHLKGLPLDLRSLEGLSFASGLIGEPKETYEFTRNLTDLNLAHVKIEADLTTRLPELIELKRTSGEIIPVTVEYPWIPPTCAFSSAAILHQTSQSITTEILLGPTQRFIFTVVYASNLSSERSDLWVDLLDVHQSLSLDAVPWIVGGDFNQIIHFSEHSNPAINCFDPPMTEFRDALSELGLFDLRYNGPLFTWTNKCPSSPIAKKLDRCLVNHSWISSYPHSLASFIAPEISDHSPSIIDLAVNLPSPGTRPFKFNNYLTKHHLFYQTVNQAWNQAGGIAMDLSYLCVKLKKIKGDLKKLNRDNFSDIQTRVRETNNLLQTVQVQVLNQPTEANMREEKKLLDRWEFLRMIEESYFRQRSRINWLREGDLNTAFFHRLTQHCQIFLLLLWPVRR